MPNRNTESAYRYGYQGEYAEKEEIGSTNSFELRLYDSRINRWMTTDPAGQYHSPYLSMGNNWVNMIDKDGAVADPSTGVQDNGDGTYTVVGARNDGDTGIYIVDADRNWDINTSQSIGNTLNPWDFMLTDDKTGEFKGHKKLTFSFNNLEDGLAIFERYTGAFQNIILTKGFSHSSASLALLASMSRNNGPLDIKLKYPEESGGKYTPVSLGNNTITTIRSLSNIIFGDNMRTINKCSWDLLFMHHNNFYHKTMPWVGAYNQKSNNPGGERYNVGYPFYGEHTYSGTNIYFGYYGRMP